MLSVTLASKVAGVIRNAGARPNKEKAGAATPAFSKMINTNTSIIAQSVKIAAIYCRVSTDDQADNGTSLDTQRAACLEYCQQHGYKVTYQLAEVWSRWLLERPELDKLRTAIRNREITHLVVYCLDRLSGF